MSNKLAEYKDLNSFHKVLTGSFGNYTKKSHPQIVGTFGGRSYTIKGKEDIKVSLKEIMIHFSRLVTTESDQEQGKEIFQIIHKLKVLGDKELEDRTKTNSFRRTFTYIKEFFANYRWNEWETIENTRKKLDLEQAQTYDFNIIDEKQRDVTIHSGMSHASRRLLACFLFDKFKIPEIIKKYNKACESSNDLHKRVLDVDWMMYQTGLSFEEFQKAGACVYDYMNYLSPEATKYFKFDLPNPLHESLFIAKLLGKSVESFTLTTNSPELTS